MQTFMPYPSFAESAASLDKRRCFKQVIEAKQIIACLEGTSNVKWKNHPAVKQWDGYVDMLKHYYNVFLKHCIQVHKYNTKMGYMNCEYDEVDQNDTSKIKAKRILNYIGEYPWWWNEEQYHRSHRARLIAKDEKFYLPKFPEDKDYNGGKYWWADMETKTFKIIN